MQYCTTLQYRVALLQFYTFASHKAQQAYKAIAYKAYTPQTAQDVSEYKGCRSAAACSCMAVGVRAMACDATVVQVWGRGFVKGFTFSCTSQQKIRY